MNPLGWDVKVDGSPGDRGFRAEYFATDLANYMLHTLDGTGPMTELRAFTYNGQQDYITAIPEPATIALLGFGGAFSLLRRKRWPRKRITEGR